MASDGMFMLGLVAWINVRHEQADLIFWRVPVAWIFTRGVWVTIGACRSEESTRVASRSNRSPAPRMYGLFSTLDGETTTTRLSSTPLIRITPFRSRPQV